MTIKTWKEEFYPKNPTKKMSKLDAIKHSLTKWRGLTKTNLKKHDLKITRNLGTYVADKIGERMEINSGSCALCTKYLIANFTYKENECEKCPLYKSLGDKECGDGSGNAPFTHWADRADPNPMIKALEKCLKEDEDV